MSALGPVEKLRADHDLATFDCGKEELNRFLQRFALANQQANSTQTYVACRDKAVVGYYSLTVGAVAHAVATERVRKAMPRYPISVMILARLAVDARQAGQWALGRLFSRMRSCARPRPRTSPASARFWPTQKITT